MFTLLSKKRLNYTETAKFGVFCEWQQKNVHSLAITLD